MLGAQLECEEAEAGPEYEMPLFYVWAYGLHLKRAINDNLVEGKIIYLVDNVYLTVAKVQRQQLPLLLKLKNHDCRHHRRCQSK